MSGRIQNTPRKAKENFEKNLEKNLSDNGEAVGGRSVPAKPVKTVNKCQSHSTWPLYFDSLNILIREKRWKKEKKNKEG